MTTAKHHRRTQTPTAKHQSARTPTTATRNPPKHIGSCQKGRTFHSLFHSPGRALPKVINCCRCRRRSPAFCDELRLSSGLVLAELVRHVEKTSVTPHDSHFVNKSDIFSIVYLRRHLVHKIKQTTLRSRRRLVGRTYVAILTPPSCPHEREYFSGAAILFGRRSINLFVSRNRNPAAQSRPHSIMTSALQSSA